MVDPEIDTENRFRKWVAEQGGQTYKVSRCCDEIVCEVPLDIADDCAIFMDKVMCRGLPWARGLPLETEIWKGERYRK